jgi:hypothetical protein
MAGSHRDVAGCTGVGGQDAFRLLSGPTGERLGASALADVFPAGAALAGDRRSGTGSVLRAQEQTPGALLQLDWTDARELRVRIQGEELDHLFCHCVLPYSNWQWATRCLSESFLSLVSGFQAAVSQLGKGPLHLVTDNSSAATHELEAFQQDQSLA